MKIFQRWPSCSTRTDGRTDGRTDRQTDMTKIVVNFWDFENASNKTRYLITKNSVHCAKNFKQGNLNGCKKINKKF
jgi:hypothetical protein